MDQWIMEHESIIRMSFFFGTFLVVALWEILYPRRPLTTSKVVRWYSNIGIVFFNSLILRAIIPIFATGMAISAKENGWGLFNVLDLPYGFKVFLSFMMLDCAIYLQHVMFHFVPLFWRLHRMHHADLDYDVTTGARFHTLEIVLSMGIKLAVISVIGPPVIAVLAFEVVLNLTSMFNHGNIYIPPKIDRILRFLFVTPDMHRVHHSVLKEETNSNFGFSFPWWDRLFGTYRAQPRAGHDQMTIGLSQFRNPQELHLHRLLAQPFVQAPETKSHNLKNKF